MTTQRTHDRTSSGRAKQAAVHPDAEWRILQRDHEIRAEKIRRTRKHCPPVGLIVPILMASFERNASPREVLQVVARLYGVPAAAIGNGRARAVADARIVAITVLCQRLRMSANEMAVGLGMPRNGVPDHVRKGLAGESSRSQSKQQEKATRAWNNAA